MTSQPPAQTDNRLYGQWVGADYPGLTSFLVFCKDGRGLLFHYDGGDCEISFVDEFSWQQLREGVIELEWIVKHDLEFLLNEEDEDDDSEPSDERVVVSGVREKLDYRFEAGNVPSSFLYIDFDLHALHFDPLCRWGEAGSFEEERAKLQSWVGKFDFHDSFGFFAARDSAGSPETWRRIREERGTVRTRRGRSLAPPRSENLIRPVTILQVIGLSGLAILFADRLKPILHPYAFVALVCVPSLIEIFREDGDTVSRWGRAITRVRTFASGWYLALTVTACLAVACGIRVKGWPFAVLMVLVGTLPHIKTFTQRRRTGPTEPR